MRKITKEAIKAFYNAEKFSSSNTQVIVHDNGTELVLHGNCIASLNRKTNILSITNCGWFSNTTKERLNALKGVSIQQKKGVWYLNGKEWGGEVIDIN